MALRTTGILTSVVDAIGNTPLVELGRIVAGRKGRLLAKLEYLNPGFSKKDRVARQMIEDAERDGHLKPGATVVELTSGNTGTGLAIVCACRGYRFVAVMSRGNSVERARMMRALGAEVILVPQSPGSLPGHVSGEDLNLLEAEVLRVVATRGAFRADQFRLRGHYTAHSQHTAQEFLQQTGGRLNPFCDFVGSGGTLGGCAETLKAFNSAIRCYAVEPDGVAVLAGVPATASNHPIQGGGYGRNNLLALRPDLIDGYITVTGDEAREGARMLARSEGIFAGFSSGANVMAALKLLDGPERGSTVAFTVCDSGLKYLSTDLWPELNNA